MWILLVQNANLRQPSDLRAPRPARVTDHDVPISRKSTPLLSKAQLIEVKLTAIIPGPENLTPWYFFTGIQCSSRYWRGLPKRISSFRLGSSLRISKVMSFRTFPLFFAGLIWCGIAPSPAQDNPKGQPADSTGEAAFLESLHFAEDPPEVSKVGQNSKEAPSIPKGSIVPLVGGQPPEVTFEQALQLMDKAFTLLDASGGKMPEARLDLLRRAKSLLVALQHKDPDWKTELVAEQVQRAGRRLEELREGAIAKKREAGPPAAVPVPPGGLMWQAESPGKESRPAGGPMPNSEVQELQMRLQEAMQALQASRERELALRAVLRDLLNDKPPPPLKFPQPPRPPQPLLPQPPPR